MHTNNLTITDETAVELLLAAHKFNLSHLEERRSQYIKQAVDGSNVCLFYDAIKNIEAFKDITKMFLAYIDSKWAATDRNIKFQDISIDGLKHIVDHLSKGFRRSGFHLNLFGRIIDWAKDDCIEKGVSADGPNLRKALEGAEQLISFTTMTLDGFLVALNPPPDFFTLEEVGSIFTKSKPRPIEPYNNEHVMLKLRPIEPYDDYLDYETIKPMKSTARRLSTFIRFRKSLK